MLHKRRYIAPPEQRERDEMLQLVILRNSPMLLQAADILTVISGMQMECKMVAVQMDHIRVVAGERHDQK